MEKDYVIPNHPAKRNKIFKTETVSFVLQSSPSKSCHTNAKLKENNLFIIICGQTTYLKGI